MELTPPERMSTGTLRVAPRMADIKPFYVMEIQRRAFELEATGRRIIHFEIGQPDRGAPPSVIAATQTVIERDALGYTDALGIAPLRRRIAAWYQERYGVAVSADEVVVTPGASGAFMIVCGTLVGPGDEILLPDPTYPCNRHFVRMFEGVPVAIPVDAAADYQLRESDVARHWRASTRGVMLATPSNPTGTRIGQAALGAIADTVRARGGITIVDEIYQGLTYGPDPDATALAVARDAIVINSFSKYFGMTGWRIGWIVAPASIVREMERFAQNAFICPPVPAQHAALAAFEPAAIAEFEARRREFERRRDYIVAALRDLGFGVPNTPTGAFYVYADCSALAADANTFAWDVLERAGVALTPGKDFGEHGATRHVRFAYTRSMDDLREGMRRLAAYLGRAGWRDPK